MADGCMHCLSNSKTTRGTNSSSPSPEERCVLCIDSLEGKKNKVPFQRLSLGNVDPTDFRSNPSAFDKLLIAVDPILGNLREVHEFWSRNESRDIETPLMVFTIESWAVCEEKAFGLLECTPI